MTSDTPNDARPSEDIDLKLEVDGIADLDAPEDDADLINGGCKESKPACSPTHETA